MKAFFFSAAILMLLVAGVRGQAVSPDEKLLKAARIATDGPGLLDFFAKQAATAEQQKALPTWIAQLGSPAFAQREKAQAELIAMELAAVPALSQVMKDGDLETSRRAEFCLVAIRKGNPVKTLAAVRVLHERQPSGTVTALLAYLPYAEHRAVEQAIMEAVYEVDADDGKQAVPALVNALKNPLPSVRVRAGKALAFLGLDAQAAAAALAEAARDRDAQVQLQTLVALENIGPAAKEAIPALVKLLVHDHDEIRLHAHQILGQVGAGRKEVLAALHDRLVDAKNKEQLYAANALWEIGPTAIPVLLDALARGPDRYAKRFSAAALCRIAPGKPEVLARLMATFAVEELGESTAHALPFFGPTAVEPLSGFLTHEEASVRARAAKCLGRFGPYAKPAAAKLRAALKDAQLPVRTEAAIALWSIDHQPSAIMPVLLDGLKNDADSWRKEAICSVLGQMDPLPADAVKALLQLLKQTPQPNFLRFYPVFALTHAETHAKLVAPVMIEVLLKDKDASARRFAAHALQNMGPATPDVIPTLARALSDPDPFVRTAALTALRSMGGRARVTLPVLIEALKKETEFDHLASLIGGLGPDAQDAVPALIAALEKHPMHAALALGQMGPGAKKAIPNLIRQLANPYDNAASQNALVRIGPDAIAPLLAALDDKNAQISYQASQTLGRMGPAAVGDLQKVLKNRHGFRWGAARALGMIGPAAKAAVPDLIDALDIHEPALKRSAAWALGEIRLANRGVIEALADAVQDGPCANEALASLARFGPKARAALPAVRNALKNPRLQLNAAEALAKIDPKAAEPLAILVKRVHAEKGRWFALQTARRLGIAAKEMIDVLPPALDDRDYTVHREAIGYLAEISRQNDAAIPVLIAAAENRQSWVREKALETLGQLGPKAKAGVPVLIKALGHRSVETRLAAAQALAHLGPAAMDAVPALKAHLQSHDPVVLPFVAAALWKIDGPSEEVVQGLIKAFRTSQHARTKKIRVKAADVLAELGPRAKAALPDLLEAAHDTGGTNTGNLDVRPHAAWAVWKIDGQADTVVHSLIHSLKVCHHPARGKAAQALAAIGPPAQRALPTLRRVLGDCAAEGPSHAGVRAAIAAAIKKLE